MACKGICEKYKPHGNVSDGRYKVGQKRCRNCETYIQWDGLWCPCCGCMMRAKPRNRKHKEALL